VLEGKEDIFVVVVVPVYIAYIGECTRVTVIVSLNLPATLKIGSRMTTFLVSLFYPLFVQGLLLYITFNSFT